VPFPSCIIFAKGFSYSFPFNLPPPFDQNKSYQGSALTKTWSLIFFYFKENLEFTVSLYSLVVLIMTCSLGINLKVSSNIII